MLHTNHERLRASLLAMSEIGVTAGGGLTRLALSDEDRAARDLFGNMARGCGLSVRVDDLGTQYARLPGTDPDAAPVVLGSHLDSVPAGGRFDGTLGVMVALEVVRSIGEAGIKNRRALEVVNFTNEEGVRFEPAMMASGVLAGRFSPEYVFGRRDSAGHSFGDELERIGYQGEKRNRLRTVHAYIETHIEQGPVLEAEGLHLAAVTGIVGVEWMNVVIKGQSQHAGPSPMRQRRDAMVAAGRIISGLRDLALQYDDPVAITVGRLQPTPGVVNQIPGQVVMSVDLRHREDQGQVELAQRAEQVMRAVASEERVEIAVESIWKIPPTHFDPSLVDLIESEIRSAGIAYRRMTSSAGHDAKYMSEIAPTAMLFVRTIGGMSHCESEAIEWGDACSAAEVLLRIVMRLAE